MSAVPSKMMSIVQAIARERDGNRGSPGDEFLAQLFPEAGAENDRTIHFARPTYPK